MAKAKAFIAADCRNGIAGRFREREGLGASMGIMDMPSVAPAEHGEGKLAQGHSPALGQSYGAAME
jgi:hypothetical protein